MKLIRVTTLTVGLAVCLHSMAAAADESSALAVLAATDSKLEAKAMACDELGRVGTAKAVPVLSKLLADDKLHDYARDGLERIQHPSAGKALLASLGELKGSLRIGVISTLGDRGDQASVPALVKIVQSEGESERAVSAALTSLAQIGSDDATKAILSVLAKGSGPAKVAAARAALLAAERLAGAGNEESASKLRQAVAGADGVPDYLKKAAG